MGTVPPRFDDKDDKRLLEKALAGGWLSEMSANAALAISRPFAKTGRKFHEGAKRRGYLGNKKRQAQLAEDHKKWQAAAVSIWLNRPDLSTRAVAGMIARRLGANKETVRKHIRPPEATH